jgi:hypothetical protein
MATPRTAATTMSTTRHRRLRAVVEVAATGVDADVDACM